MNKLSNPIHITYPYDIEIRTDGDAAEYIIHQCDRCPRGRSNWDCSGAQVSKCKAAVYDVIDAVKSKLNRHIKKLSDGGADE